MLGTGSVSSSSSSSPGCGSTSSMRSTAKRASSRREPCVREAASTRASSAGSLTRPRKRTTICSKRTRYSFFSPCIDHGNMGSRVKKTLVLVLTAQVDVRSHALTELANAGERAIDFHAAATI